jgi:hypothetical protein
MSDSGSMVRTRITLTCAVSFFGVAAMSCDGKSAAAGIGDDGTHAAVSAPGSTDHCKPGVRTDHGPLERRRYKHLIGRDAVTPEIAQNYNYVTL